MKVTEQGRRKRKSGICGVRQAQKKRTEEGIHPHGHNSKGNIQIVVRRQSCLVAKTYTSARLNQCLPPSPCFVLSIPSTVSISLSLKKSVTISIVGDPKKRSGAGKLHSLHFPRRKKKIGTKGNGGTFISPSFYLNKKYGNAKKARKVMKVRSQRERVICQVGRKGSCGFFAHFICPPRTTVVDLIN